MSTRTEQTRGAAAERAYDAQALRADFPALHQEVNGRPLVYLDSAATTLKPRAVIEAVEGIYGRDCANIHRGVHLLSMRATDAFEAARTRLARFIGAPRRKEVIFVRGATEGINLVAQSYGRPRLKAGDEILITHLEHHSNIVPWQLLCEQTGAKLVVVPIDDRGAVMQDEYARLLTERTRIVAVAHVSNALGTVNPIARMAEMAHAHGAVVLVDGAQAAPHTAVDVRALGADFYVLSGHKMYGPTGVGVLWGRAELLESMPPYQGGGDMILSVSFEKTVYNELPHKFEAGTPHIAGVVGLGAAAEYLEGVGLERIAAHEHALLERATALLQDEPGVQLIGTAPVKAAVLSFRIAGVHPHDVGTILDQEGIAIRTGHHCAQPVMDRFGVAATARASFGLYNTPAEVDALLEGVRAVQKIFR
jgi:cysteine desulfurase / selenocysteine lyase